MTPREGKRHQLEVLLIIRLVFEAADWCGPPGRKKGGFHRMSRGVRVRRGGGVAAGGEHGICPSLPNRTWRATAAIWCGKRQCLVDTIGIK